MEIDKRFVGIMIAAIRDKKNQTLEEFGKLIDGATKSNVSKWEKGEVLPNRKRLKMIADYGGINVNEMLYGPFDMYASEVFFDAQDKFFKKYIGEDGMYNADGVLISGSYNSDDALSDYLNNLEGENYDTMDYKKLSHLAETVIKNSIGKKTDFETVNDLIDELIVRMEGNKNFAYRTFFKVTLVEEKPTIVLKEGFDIKEYNEIVTLLDKFKNEIEGLKKFK